ncbi:hypothetical protein CHELA40_15335 [Chelatococcus asaccharovorans]|nr:hypothetical protein CHELA17_60282 [Chelatococcus asaccharovorans]CAH1682208.1 hypothetical protein CHELA40_15335 [Chelatococcus asaccharovorans]
MLYRKGTELGGRRSSGALARGSGKDCTLNGACALVAGWVGTRTD